MTNFRSRSEEIENKLEFLQDELKDLTSNRKSSKNQALNFAVILAFEKLNDINEALEYSQSNYKSELENKKEYADF